MSDLIETWKNDFRAFVNSLNLDRDDYKTMMEYIDEIPAVQPDHVADIGKKAEGDCISRQAAIDALAKQMPKSYTLDGSHPADEEIFKAQEVYADCIKTIELLLAAQPEQRWIPCSERLPEEQRYCLTSCRNGLVCEDFHWNNGYFDKADKYHHEVIAWMPLPEVYQKEGDT